MNGVNQAIVSRWGGSSKQEVQSNLRNEPALVTSATSGVLLWRSQLVQLVFANHRKSLDKRVISTAFVIFSDPFKGLTDHILRNFIFRAIGQRYIPCKVTFFFREAVNNFFFSSKGGSASPTFF